MSLANTPERFAQRGLSAHTSMTGLLVTAQDVAAGVSGAVVGGLVAASTVPGRDALADIPATSRASARANA
ncbi:hypothetical protein [Streptomyces sp. NBC_01518]|uniref:hypothetical protein n=1 Tax=Streptomyces sp. NBC_01518 TaxID=2903891 RepID=UPI00386B19E3